MLWHINSADIPIVRSIIFLMSRYTSNGGTEVAVPSLALPECFVVLKIPSLELNESHTSASNKTILALCCTTRVLWLSGKLWVDLEAIVHNS